MIDFHSHILPGIDDGSASLEESLAMLQLAKEQGITHMVATPHFYPNYDAPDRFFRRRERAEEALRQALAEHPGLPEITVGAEVYFFSGISESDIIQELTIGKKGCILIEMPHSPWSESMYRELAQIWEKQGIVPIVAHVDRYIGPFRTHGIPERLAELPVVVQANADFFLQASTARMALRMLRADQIQLLGSDCHNMRSRKPNLGAALTRIEKKLGKEPLNTVYSRGAELLGFADR